jgi:aspartyl-tRNA(Asn)/glutamyl-tRNA(Gln) amidotransferase subunit B
MEEGSMRADVNVSVRKPDGELGTRTETKNVNSVRFVMAVVEHEAKRQVELLEGGGTVAQETRLYDPDKGVTRSLRSKEDAHDYRYFPDPDLLPLELDEAFLAECKLSLPELPDAKRKRYVDELGLTPYDAAVLTAEKAIAEYFEASLEKQVAKSGRSPREVAKTVANWIISIDMWVAKRRSVPLGSFNPTANTAVVALVSGKEISLSAAKEIYPQILDRVYEIKRPTDEEIYKVADEVVESSGLKQVSDTGAIDAEIDKILAANADKVAEYKAGKQQLFGFFVGQTMKAMQGKANPQVVNERLRTKLG